jgi:hypothetical protein
MSKPAAEVDLGAYSLEAALNHRPFPIPARMSGPSLLYLRSSKGVLTRPLLIEGTPFAVPPQDPLARAMCVNSFADRESALAEITYTIHGGGEPGYQLLRSLIELVSSLDGIPPGAFDILMKVAAEPSVAAQLALFAADTEKPAVLQLTEGLPFAWYTIPKQCWEAAAEAYIGFFEPKLLPVYGEKALAEALKLAASSARTIADYQPILASQLNISCSIVTILEAAQNLIRRSADKVADTYFVSPFRPALEEQLPPCFGRFDANYLGVLDAPCAAALAALGKFEPDNDQLRRIKSVERSNPIYFAEAFSAWYQEKLNG